MLAAFGLYVGSCFGQVVPVTLQHTGDTWTLLRGGAPYYIKGVGGSTKLDVAKNAGANSTRTWGNNGASDSTAILDAANANGLTTMLGFWLDQNLSTYTTSYKNAQLAAVQSVATAVKNHPALLCYAIGNELNNSNTNTVATWQYLETLALAIKAIDPNHPVITVIAGADTNAMNSIATYAPHIDIIGVNVYAGGIPGMAAGITAATSYKGPYIVTEWGPGGYWEVPVTSWGAPFEQTSKEKADSYLTSYQSYILPDTKRGLGSYVFLWGQKEERTPTWFGMFAEVGTALNLNGESMPTVDVMETVWKGVAPANSAPSMQGLWLDGVQVTNVTSSSALTRGVGQTMKVQAKVTEPNGDPITYKWEVLQEASVLGNGGSAEPRPTTVTGVITAGATPDTITVTVPAVGNYRVYAYALDGRGKIATANFPFASIAGSVTPTVPAKIEAENYTAMSGVQTESTTDAGGGQNVGYIDTGDWLEYTINVPTAGVYQLDLRVAGLGGNGGSVTVRPGTASPVTLTLPVTGGWQTWTTVTTSVTLNAGLQTLRLDVANGGFNFNWLQFSSSSTNAAWLAQSFTAAEIANPAISGDTADPDGDLIPNLLEYKLGSDPKVNRPLTAKLEPRTVNGAARVHYEINYKEGRDDVLLVPEVSTDLKTWSSTDANLVQTTTSNGDGTALFVVEYPTPATGGVFIRLKATRK